MSYMKNVFKDWKWYELAYIIVSFIALITVTIVCKSWIVTLFVALFGLVGTALNTKTNKFCFIFYVISAVLYAYVAFTEKYYGEMILNICYIIPIYTISTINIFRHNKEKISFQVAPLKLKTLIIIVLLGALVIIGYGFILKYIGSALPFLNSAATAFCASASYLASRKNIGQWYFWLIYNVVQFALWFLTISADNLKGIPLIVLNIIYFGINIYGLITWLKIMKNNKVEGSEKND